MTRRDDHVATSPPAEPAGGDVDHRALAAIGAVAARTGVSERTLRYYEELGLLSPAAHDPGRCRRYSEADVQRILHIRELQRLMGFNLEEIRDVVAAEDHLDALREQFYDTGDVARQRDVLEEAVRTLENLRDQVRAKQDHLRTFLSQLDARIERNSRRLASEFRESPPVQPSRPRSKREVGT